MAGYLVEDEVVAGYGNLTGESLTAIQAIRHFCIECQGGHYFDWVDNDGKKIKATMTYEEVKACESSHCYLYPFRTGRNPRRQTGRKLSDEQKARMQAGREAS